MAFRMELVVIMSKSQQKRYLSNQCPQHWIRICDPHMGSYIIQTVLILQLDSVCLKFSPHAAFVRRIQSNFPKPSPAALSSMKAAKTCYFLLDKKGYVLYRRIAVAQNFKLYTYPGRIQTKGHIYSYIQLLCKF
jgi:hypothetical protein